MRGNRSWVAVVALGALGALGLPACAVTSDAPATASSAEALQAGTPVAPASRPWAAFVVATVSSGTLKCSGALIAPNLVLTSARCTVCASAISVGFIGESLAAGAPPPVWHGNAAAGISTEAGAFTSTPTCTGTPTDIALDIGNKRIDGHALGLVRLSAPVGLPTITPMTQPPYGFSPVQDLAGPQKLTIVSGGSTALFGGPVEMRELKVALTSYSNTTVLPDCDPTQTQPFTMQREMVSNQGAIDGDEGGAWLAKVNGVDRLVGVAQAAALGLFDNAAPTFTLNNANFIKAGLGLPTGQLDSDGDEVPDVVDNCPLDANRDQIDRDGDGVGDVCDNCAPEQGNGTFLPGPLDTFDPSAGPFSAYYNPGQENCNAEAEDRAILSDDPSLAGGGGVRHLSDADYIASFGSAIWGACQTSPLGKITKHRRGDVCDPIPCAKPTPKTTSVPTASFGPLAAVCGGNGYAIGVCTFEAISGWDLQAAGGTSPTAGQDGLRLCQCNLPHATPAERRLFCAASPANCAIDPALYQLNHPAWKKLALVGAGPDGEKLTSIGFSSGTATVDWNYQADLVALTGTAMPPLPWTVADDGTLVGGPKLKGVLWSHVVTYGGQPTSSLAPIANRSVALLASAYDLGDHQFFRETHWIRVPRYKPHYWWEYCAGCRLALEQRWVEVMRDRAGTVLGTVALGTNGGTDISARVDATAAPLLAMGTHVNAMEAEATLVQAGVATRAVVLRAGSLEVVGTLGAGANGTGIAGQAIQSEAQPLATGEAVATVFSGTRGELFALRQVVGKPTQLMSFALRTQRWQTLRLAGDRLGTPLAAGFSPTEQALYALDRVTGTTVRLVRVALEDGAVTVVCPNLLDATFSALALRVTSPTTLLVVGADARAGVTNAAHLRLATDSSLLTVIDRGTLARDQMVGDAYENAAGVLFQVAAQDGFEPRVLAPSAFAPVNLPVKGPVF
jgi:Trypsin